MGTHSPHHGRLKRPSRPELGRTKPAELVGQVTRESGSPHPGTPASLLLHLCPVTTVLDVSPFQIRDLKENPAQADQQQNINRAGSGSGQCRAEGVFLHDPQRSALEDPCVIQDRNEE